MRHNFAWTVAITLVAVGCGSDPSPSDVSSGGTDAVAGSSTAAAGHAVTGGEVQTNAGGATTAVAGTTGNAAAGQPGTAVGVAGATSAPELVGGASSVGVGGATFSTAAGSPSIGGGTASAAAGSCAVTYYRDADGDTWGAAESSCSGGAGWVTRTGDCNDVNANVFPYQTTTFEVPYVASNGAQSFDYNCDGSETIAGGTQESTGECKTSGMGNACTGDGYLPVEPARSGTDLNQLCGSMRYLVCARSQQVCIGAISTDGTYQAARCR